MSPFWHDFRSVPAYLDALGYSQENVQAALRIMPMIELVQLKKRLGCSLANMVKMVCVSQGIKYKRELER